MKIVYLTTLWWSYGYEENKLTQMQRVYGFKNAVLRNSNSVDVILRGSSTAICFPALTERSLDIFRLSYLDCCHQFRRNLAF